MINKKTVEKKQQDMIMTEGEEWRGHSFFMHGCADAER
jgi:hypothetical protein